MKALKIILPAFVAFLTVGTITAFIDHKKEAVPLNKGFAVVELFTSEGCSSCPPADALVAKVQQEVKDKPVYILAFHVDYWDRLGWKDAFSSADFSKRQREYAGYLHLQSVYTPQIVVNGKTEFVGSEEGSLRNAIKANLQKTSTAGVMLNVDNINHDQANVKYNITGTDKNAVLLLAVLQKNGQTNVERGENGGRKLSHVQIVRKLQRVALNGMDGQVKIALPAGFDAQAWEIIGFLQNTQSGEVTGAAKASLPADAGATVAVKNSK